MGSKARGTGPSSWCSPAHLPLYRNLPQALNISLENWLGDQSRGRELAEKSSRTHNLETPELSSPWTEEQAGVISWQREVLKAH